MRRLLTDNLPAVYNKRRRKRKKNMLARNVDQRKTQKTTIKKHWCSLFHLHFSFQVEEMSRNVCCSFDVVYVFWLTSYQVIRSKCPSKWFWNFTVFLIVGLMDWRSCLDVFRSWGYKCPSTMTLRPWCLTFWRYFFFWHELNYWILWILCKIGNQSGFYLTGDYSC